VTPLADAGTLAPLLFVSGMKSEASIAEGPDAHAVCGNAATLTEKLRAIGAVRLVVSFGLCGGLDPALRRGDIVVGAKVVAGGQTIDADSSAAELLARRLSTAGEGTHLGAVACVDRPVLIPDDKARLRLATGATAVDMESLVAARFAQERGIPLAILRVVCDPADRAVPAIATEALRPDGGVDLARVLARSMASPAQIPGLLAVARDSAMAHRGLRRCRGLPGLFLGLGLAQL
jgi:adenosylhomocysteine nucleosidase